MRFNTGEINININATTPGITANIAKKCAIE
jgi:hypothetical protein